MDTLSLSEIFLFLGTIALVLFLIIFGVVLFYTINILRTIYEVMTLAKKQVNGISLKAEDFRRYIGGSTMIRFLLFLFRKKGRKNA